MSAWVFGKGQLGADATSSVTVIFATGAITLCSDVLRLFLLFMQENEVELQR